MSSEQVLMAVVGALALASLLLALVAARIAAGARRESEAAQAAARVAEARLADLEAAAQRRTTAPATPPAPEPAAPLDPPGAPSYVITHVGEAVGADPEPVAGRIDGALFADLVARESFVKAASLAHGVRRALSPENRNRIRFEMKQEVKRSRKQRKADRRQAIREWEARQRAAMADGADADGEDSAA